MGGFRRSKDGQEAGILTTTTESLHPTLRLVQGYDYSQLTTSHTLTLTHTHTLDIYMTMG